MTHHRATSRTAQEHATREAKTPRPARRRHVGRLRADGDASEGQPCAGPSQASRGMEQEDGSVNEWQPIETAPKDRTMVVLIGVTEGNGFTGGRPYRSDPWCGWFSDGEWQRWPHPWPPTHWMPLPAPPST